MKKLIIFIIFILFLILGILGFWYWNKNPYSKDILKIEILAPTEANFAEEIEYTVKYKNNGDVRLEEPRLVFEFPEYTVVDETFVRRKEIGPEELGDIYLEKKRPILLKEDCLGKRAI